MSDWIITETTKEYKMLTNTKTGSMRKVPFASDKQFNYLQSLREQLGKPPLKHRPEAYKASKAINKALEQIKKRDIDENQKVLL